MVTDRHANGPGVSGQDGWTNAVSDRAIINATVSAPAARAWMATTRCPRVYQSFSHACNLINETGDILALVTPHSEPGPFVVMVLESEMDGKAVFEAIRASDRVEIDRTSLLLGPYRIETASAVLWNPRPDWMQLEADPWIYRWVARMVRHALEEAPPGSLAILIADQLERDEQSKAAASETLTDSILMAARKYSNLLIHGLGAGDPKAISAGSAGLAGLGPGLTPAGDDFLVGAIYGLWATRSPRQAVRLARLIVEPGAPRTTALSGAWLHAAARGEADGTWHHLVDAISVGRESRVLAACQDILGRGHTSGADALAGFWAVVDFVDASVS